MGEKIENPKILYFFFVVVVTRARLEDAGDAPGL